MTAPEASQTFVSRRTLAPRWAIAVRRGCLGWRASWRTSHKSTWTRWATHHRSAAHWAGPHESAWTRWATHHRTSAHWARPHETAWARWSTHHRTSAHRAAPLVIRQRFQSDDGTITRWSRSQRCIYASMSSCDAPARRETTPTRHVQIPERFLENTCSPRPPIMWGCTMRSICEVLVSRWLKLSLTPMPPGLSELFIAPIPKEPEPMGPRGPAFAGGQKGIGPVGIPPLPVLGPADACDFQPHKVVSYEAG